MIPPLLIDTTAELALKRASETIKGEFLLAYRAGFAFAIDVVLDAVKNAGGDERGVIALLVSKFEEQLRPSEEAPR